MIITMIKYIVVLVHPISLIQKEEDILIMNMELVQYHQLLIFLIIIYLLKNLAKKI
jgi:hypothetical protein